MADYRIVIAGKADPELVRWIERLITLLRALPTGWTVEMTLERRPADDQT